MWFEGILRTLFIFIDRVVYWLVDKVYGLFIMISETGLFTQDAIRTFAGRIYVLLGIFMLFKVSFSLITYVLNPDAMTDKSKGMGNLVKRIIIVLVGIIAVPYVFQAAYSLQNIILKDNIIGNIILGDAAANGFDSDDVDYIEYGGKIMAHTTLSAFLKLNPAVVGENCAEKPVMDGEFNEADCDFAALEEEISENSTVRTVLEEGYANKDTSVYFNTDLILLKAENENGEEDWLFEYSILLSTICGGFLAWILLLFCIDIATRSVKLGFLQLVAPIPVISYVDPKGEKIFQKWLGECGKTYADIFVRLVAIYFVIFIVATLELNGMHNVMDPSIKVDNILVKIFIIFGALMFAKQLPDLISNITGIKFNGGFTLNPMNKLQQIPLVGAGATNLLGRTAGAIETAHHDQTGNKWRAAASGWFAAGDALHGKVPLMGAKPGASTVRSIHTGRDAGHEVATGSKLKAHSFVNDMFRETGQKEIDRLKKVREPLQQELTKLNLDKQETASAYNRLKEQLSDPKTTNFQKRIIEEKMKKAQLHYQQVSEREAKINGDIGTINDQIKDLERAYSIDKSPKASVEKVEKKVKSQGDGFVLEDNAYGDPLESIDYSIPTPGTTRVKPRPKNTK